MNIEITGKEEIRSFYQLDAIVIMVLYNTSLQSSEAFISLNAALKKVNADIILDIVVYDNSPSPFFDETSEIGNWNVTYISDPSNPGLSKGSNEAYKIAQKKTKKWILFTNPDTSFPEDYFFKLYTSVKGNPSINLFAPVLVSNGLIVSPAKFKFNIGSSLNNVSPGINILTDRSLLYSGLFISSSTFEKIGGFNDDIKLDFMDFYLIERYKEIYNNFFLVDAWCNHDLSSFEKNKSKILRRFAYYCEGARNYGNGIWDYLSLFLLCLARSIKLTLRCKDISFVTVFFKKFAFGKKAKKSHNARAFLA